MTPHDPAALRALQERVRSAEGADIELDAAIDVTIFGGETVWKTTRYTMEQYPASRRPSLNHVGGFANEYVPRVTSSIDACVALIEKVLPGHDFKLMSCGSDGSYATVFQHGWMDDTRVDADGKTPPLALLAALLRALILIEEHKAIAEGEVR